MLLTRHELNVKLLSICIHIYHVYVMMDGLSNRKTFLVFHRQKYRKFFSVKNKNFRDSQDEFDYLFRCRQPGQLKQFCQVSMETRSGRRLFTRVGRFITPRDKTLGSKQNRVNKLSEDTARGSGRVGNIDGESKVVGGVLLLEIWGIDLLLGKNFLEKFETRINIGTIPEIIIGDIPMRVMVGKEIETPSLVSKMRRMISARSSAVFEIKLTSRIPPG